MRAAAGVVALVVLLAGCGADTSSGTDQETGNGDGVYPFTRTIDGRQVECIWVDGVRSGGLSCDWGRP